MSATIVLAIAMVACTAGEPGSSATTAGRSPTSVSSAQTTLAVADGAVPVIVDYSPTVSDVGGFLYLLSNPAVEVVAVSLPATGEAGCDLGAEVTFGILVMMGQQDVPVACSDEIPEGSHEWPEQFQPGDPGLLVGLPYPTSSITSQSASDLMAEVAMASERPVVIWAVAPLTNLARALTDHPDMAAKVERIVIMGGAVDVAGSPLIDPAEWNFYVDAAAAATVVSSGVPITLVPLDATNRVPVPRWYQAALNEVGQSSQIVYLARMARAFPNVTSGFYYFWDELAAVAVTDGLVLEAQPAKLVVDVGGSENGRTERDAAGSEVLVVTGVEPDAFYMEFLSQLSGEEVKIGSEATEEQAVYLLAVADSLDPLVEASSALWTDSSFGPDGTFDTDVVAGAFETVFDALRQSLEIVSSLSAPPGLVDEHLEYLSTVGSILEFRDGIVDRIRSSDGSQQELDVIFAGLPDFDPVCVAFRDQADLLGVDAAFPCG